MCVYLFVCVNTIVVFNDKHGIAQINSWSVEKKENDGGPNVYIADCLVCDRDVRVRMKMRFFSLSLFIFVLALFVAGHIERQINR